MTTLTEAGHDLHVTDHYDPSPSADDTSSDQPTLALSQPAQVPSTGAGSLDRFLSSFIGALASDDFSTAGDLTAYLRQPEHVRSGDEASVVDTKIAMLLLASLGYASKEWDYNAAKGHMRPDFSVKIEEYPRDACFIIEDKNTTETHLRQHRPQLQGYMTQRGAPRGILMNGDAILVYDHLEGGLHTPAVEVPLAKVVAAWRGELLGAHKLSGTKALEETGFYPIMAALWRRFRRQSFASLQVLIDDLTLQSEKGNGAPHRINGKTWTPSLCRIPIVAVDDTNADLLTDAIKGLIAEFEDDADAQLAAIEADYETYSSASRQLPNESVPLEVQEEQLLQDSSVLLNKAHPDARDDDLRIIRKVLRGELPLAELVPVRRRIETLVAAVSVKNAKDPVEQLFGRIRALSDKRHRYLEKLRSDHQDSIDVVQYFEVWKDKTASLVFQSSDQRKLRREFLAQTAYLVIIRLLLVRIMEDKGLVNRMFTNGGLSLWFREVESHYLRHAMGRSATFLLDLAYTSAQHIYSHFFAERTVLDWYAPDRNAVIRVLHMLAQFNLKNINRDIIGAVYNQYVEAKHKHESGMYFTPPPVAAFMLDRIGYKGPDVLGTRIIDLSCGSGGFLVEAANRLVAAHVEYWRGQGHNTIPPEEVQGVLNSIRESIFGLDLNPFACALAETNLLIQVIDLFAVAFSASQVATIDRFHIYNTDSLSFNAETLAITSGTLPFPEDELPVEDQLKAGLGHWAEGFDYVVGNPPYVRADESDGGLTQYRKRIKGEHPLAPVREAMTLKWDLFVPFVAASSALLRSGGQGQRSGKLAIITSRAIETVPYAEALRKQLSATRTINEVHFFPALKLFKDAAVENTIFIATEDAPTLSTRTLRYEHVEAPKWGSLGKAKKQSLPQIKYAQNVFRPKLPSLQIKRAVKSISFEDLFYVSKGMVLHADEKVNKGGFTLEDLLSDQQSSIHTAPFVGSKDIDAFGVKRLRYLEYGPTTRVPSGVSRPTFPELYDRPKLMVAEFGGFAYDDGSWDSGQFLKCNHSVFILMPWANLAGIENKSIKKDLAQRTKPRKQLEANSVQLDPWFALAFLNSSQMRTLLDGVARSAIRGRLQPDDLRQLHVPMPSDQILIKDVATLARDACDAQKKLLPLRANGWRFEDEKAIGPATLPTNLPLASFANARIKWGLSFVDPDARTGDLTRVGHRLLMGRRTVVTMPSSAPEDALEWLLRYLQTLPAKTTLGTVQTSLTPDLPATPAIAVQALNNLRDEETVHASVLGDISLKKSLIEQRLSPLFDMIRHPSFV